MSRISGPLSLTPSSGQSPASRPYTVDGEVYQISKNECTSNGGSSPADYGVCNPEASFKIVDDKIYGFTEKLCLAYGGHWLGDSSACIDTACGSAYAHFAAHTINIRDETNKKNQSHRGMEKPIPLIVCVIVGIIALVTIALSVKKMRLAHKAKAQASYDVEAETLKNKTILYDGFQEAPPPPLGLF